jgi:hypothetical protein
MASTDTNSNLPATIQNLQKKIAELESQNESLVSEVKALKVLSSKIFHPFMRLPIELREAIWKCAFAIPQTYIWTEQSYISRSKIQPIMQSCHEARNFGLRLKFPYYSVWQQLSTPEPKQYINPSCSTIYLPDTIFPEHDIEINCPLCQSSILYRETKFSSTCHQVIMPERLAISWDIYLAPDPSLREEIDTSQGVGSTDILRQFNGVRELLIVLGNKDIARQRDAIFVTPERLPFKVFGRSIDFTRELPNGMTLKLEAEEMLQSWEKLGLREEEILKHFKNGRKQMRDLEMLGTVFDQDTPKRKRESRLANPLP